jgi:hypothetical protein
MIRRALKTGFAVTCGDSLGIRQQCLTGIKDTPTREDAAQKRKTLSRLIAQTCQIHPLNLLI